VLAEEIGEGFICEFLEILHAIFGKQIERVPGLVIELNSLPRHGALPIAGWYRAVPRHCDSGRICLPLHFAGSFLLKTVASKLKRPAVLSNSPHDVLRHSARDIGLDLKRDPDRRSQQAR
jgi:hypothetical protein